NIATNFELLKYSAALSYRVGIVVQPLNVEPSRDSRRRNAKTITSAQWDLPTEQAAGQLSMGNICYELVTPIHIAVPVVELKSTKDKQTEKTSVSDTSAVLYL
ncbi:Hypothetical predicted protein, partial [Paramuricea clavata]